MNKFITFTITTFTLCICIAAHTEYDLEADILTAIRDQLDEQAAMYPQRDCTFAVQQITQFNVPMTITTPGLYCLAPNTAISSTQTGQLLVGQMIPGVTQATTGIIINSNNVIIDFNDTILNGSNGGALGIVINGKSNIIIRNGTITNMSNAGIFINNTAAQITGPVLINNIKFISNNIGLNANNPNNLIVKNSHSLFSTTNGFVILQGLNCFFNNCISNNNGTSGFRTVNGRSILFSQCVANNNTNFGFNTVGLIDSIFEQCQANENVQNGFTVINNTSLTAENNTITECYAEQNALSGFQIAGNQMTIEDSTALRNNIGFQVSGKFHTLSGLVAKQNVKNGIQLTGSNSLVENSHADNNNQSGFLVNGDNHIILQSAAQSNTNGFFLAPATTLGPISTNCQVRNNTAVNNATGFLNEGTTNRVYANFANDNTTANYTGITNVAISPVPATAINFTTNIAE